MNAVNNLKDLFIKLANRTITRKEKDDIVPILKSLSTNVIQQGEYDNLLTILDTITSSNSRNKITQLLSTMNNTMNNTTRRMREAQLARILTDDQLFYLSNILFKLRSGPFTPIFRGSLESFPNGQSFQDMIQTKAYESSPIIGKGGFGKVFRLDFPEQSFVLKEMILKNTHSLTLVDNEIHALQQVIGKWYAVQLLASAILIDESLILGRLGVAYILYPFIPGETLEVYQRIDHPEELSIYSQIIEAVHLLHEETGILHSDIKPENIWIPADRQVRPFLLDFGLVQSLQSGNAKNVGTSFFWSEKRYRTRKQRMTPGINWLALARTLGSELTNNNSRLLPPLRERFKKLYHNKNENTIRKNNINDVLRGTRRQNRIIVKASRTMNRPVSLPISENYSVHKSNQNTQKNKKAKR